MDIDKRANVPRQRSKLRLAVGLGLVAFGLFVLLNGVRGFGSSNQVLKAPSGQIAIEIARTAPERTQGLSGRAELADDMGLLFVFDAPASDSNCFWMKDMQFAIDMIWLTEDKRVINTVADVSPDTFPQSFCPEGDAAYGLEVAAGQAAELGIGNGVFLQF